MPEQTSPKTTKSDKTFVGLEFIDLHVLFPTVLSILRGGPAVQFPGAQGDLSEWILRLHDDPFKFMGSSISKVDAEPGLTGKGFWAELCQILILPSKRNLVKELARKCLQAGELERLQRALLLNEYESFRTILELIGKRCGIEKLNVPGLMSMVRALETTVRCAAHYRVSILSLIREAAGGDEEAVLKLVALDNMFFHDKCTKRVIAQNTFRHTKNFEADLAQSLKREIKLDKRGRTPLRLCLFTLFALGIVPKRSPRKLERLIDPEGTAFNSAGTCDRFIERCSTDFYDVKSGFLTASHRISRQG